MLDMTLELLLAVLVAYLAAVALMWLFSGLSRARPSAWRAVQSPFESIQQQSAGESARTQLRRELTDRITRGVRSDERLVEAAESTTQIQIAHRWLQESTSACLETHWALAKGLGVSHMSEAAGHPRAVALRQQNIELTEFLRDILADYPFPNPELIHLEATVPRLAATCAACPYWFVDPSEAPHVCDAARALGYTSKKSSGKTAHVIYAEPVYGED